MDSSRVEYEQISQKFLPILEFNGEEVVITQSPLGTGKTTATTNYIRYEKPQSVLFLMFRRSLTRNIVSKLAEIGLDDFVNYQKAKGMLSHPRMMIQVESLYRLKRFEFDLVVVDEITSVLNQFTSPHHREFLLANRNNFQRLFQNPRIVLLDGFIDQRTLDFVEKVSTNPIYMLRNTIRADYRQYSFILEHKIAFQIRDWVKSGKNVVVPCGTKKFAKRLFDKLKSWKITTLFFSSETRNHSLVDTINDVVKHFRVLVYTPTFQAGIDINVKHFDMMVAYGSPHSCCARDFYQMMWRVRHLSTQQVHLCIQKGKGRAVAPSVPQTDDIWEQLTYRVQQENWYSAQDFASELDQIIRLSQKDDVE